MRTEKGLKNIKDETPGQETGVSPPGVRLLGMDRVSQAA